MHHGRGIRTFGCRRFAGAGTANHPRNIRSSLGSIRSEHGNSRPVGTAANRRSNGVGRWSGRRGCSPGRVRRPGCRRGQRRTAGQPYQHNRRHVAGRREYRWTGQEAGRAQKARMVMARCLGRVLARRNVRNAAAMTDCHTLQPGKVHWRSLGDCSGNACPEQACQQHQHGQHQAAHAGSAGLG